MNHTDICPLDNQPCFVFLDVDEAHWRCGTKQCLIPPFEVIDHPPFEATYWQEIDLSGYYQGPLGIETDRPQIFDSMIVRLLLVTIAALGIWGAIWASAATISSLIPPA